MSVLVLFGFMFAIRADATVRYFHWDKLHHGNRGNVTALDLTTGKTLWESVPSKSVNFVQETEVGILTGNDAGEVVLLDKTNGKVIWRCLLRNSGEKEIKFFLGESDEGFFVASGDSMFWLVSREGKLLIRCIDGCITQGK
jgi:outer membrane protein assembly factor BamB